MVSRLHDGSVGPDLNIPAKFVAGKFLVGADLPHPVGRVFGMQQEKADVGLLTCENGVQSRSRLRS